LCREAAKTAALQPLGERPHVATSSSYRLSAVSVRSKPPKANAFGGFCYSCAQALWHGTDYDMPSHLLDTADTFLLGSFPK
jgi:hypothetical protein